jgi:galactose mutarotase-like enzyme
MGEKSFAGAAKENVLIQAGDCSLTVLPEFGGKIASIRIKGRELLQAPLSPLAHRTRTMSFDSGDASGWDECLPSVAACSVPTATGAAQVPDHGDLWRVAWETQGLGNREQGTGDLGNSGQANGTDPATLTLLGECFSLPLVLERTLSLREMDGGWRLDLDYMLTNTGAYPAPWSWAAHPLFVAEPGDRIVLPQSIHELRLAGSAGARLGNKGDAISWPEATLVGGGRTDLSVAQPPESGIGDKLFAGPLAETENWCALERPSAHLRIRVRLDQSVTPYLGLWICYGGWPDGPGPKQTCVAIEPTTAPVDSLAETGPWSRSLEPGAYARWTMRVDFESLG